MKFSRLVLVFAGLLCATLSASEAYMVVRLVDGARRDVVIRSGAVEVQHPDLREDEVLVLVTNDQLAEIQNEPNVALVYPASLELIQGVPVHSCTPPKSELMAEYIQNVGKGWGVGTASPITLTYSVQRFTPKLGREQTLEVLQRAFSAWSKHVDIVFTYTESTNAARNLNVLFASGPHGDPYRFDGPRKTLAHTFYPADVNAEPIAGDLHFDEDENWGNGVDPEFYSVVLHELGHALGLGHSDRPNAVMYPYYRKLDSLMPEDIAAIRRMYPKRQEASVEGETGKPTQPAEPAPKPNRSDTTAPTLRIVSPVMTVSSTSAATVRISGTAADTGGVAAVSWTASGGRSGVATGTTTWTIPDFALRSGDNSIVIRAYDQSGNAAWRSLTITRR